MKEPSIIEVYGQQIPSAEWVMQQMMAMERQIERIQTMCIQLAIINAIQLMNAIGREGAGP